MLNHKHAPVHKLPRDTTGFNLVLVQADCQIAKFSGYDNTKIIVVYLPSVTKGQRKWFDLKIQEAMSLAVEH